MALSTAKYTTSCKLFLPEGPKCPNFDLFGASNYSNLKLIVSQYPSLHSSSRLNNLKALPNSDFDFLWEKDPTPLLDTIDNPLHLKNLSTKELKQLADEVRSEIEFHMSKSRTDFKASLASVELTVAIHFVFNAPMDKILWDFGEQAYAHKILTGRRYKFKTIGQKDGISKFTSRTESEFDAFISGHGCNSVSAGLGMAVARDINGKRNKIITVISNWSRMAGQVYEAMNNAGYLDSNMILILNDTCQSGLNPNSSDCKEKATVNAVSTLLSKIQSSKSFRRFREAAKGLTKRIGKGLYEFAAKFDEYARGMVGPAGATLFEELGLYYIGPIDGHNIDDLICVLNQVSSLDSTGPVLLHVVTNIHKGSNEEKDKNNDSNINFTSDYSYSTLSKTYNDIFAESLLAEAERDPQIVVVTAGMGVDQSMGIFRERFPERFFDMGMAEQHAVTFAAGLCCGDLKPFCVVPSSFLQRAYDQVIQDVDMQRLPVRFAITDAGLAGPDSPVRSGAFDIAYMSCLPNAVVMAPSDEDEIPRAVATAIATQDRPTCFRFPRGSVVGRGGNVGLCLGAPFEIGKGEILVRGTEVALLGYGVMVQNCINAHSLLDRLGVRVTIADARFCKPLDIDLIRELCAEHKFIITVEEGVVGGFGSHVCQFMTLDGLLDQGKVKWRPIVLPDRYVEQASTREQFEMAGLTGHHIAATALSLLGRNREALQLMR
ncbi:hypothetical protein LUZ60_013825 [Juncus effusus]|nr:hypothetical protein LUZ60_013825 [Juncus effusus]